MNSTILESVHSRLLGIDSSNNLVMSGKIVASPDDTVRQTLLAADSAVIGVSSLKVTSSANGNNIASYSIQWSLGNNAIDPTLWSATVFGGATFVSNTGLINFGANLIGANVPANRFPLGTSGTNNNAADTYVAGTSNYSQVFGYDNTANGLMSIILGSHSVTYTASTHAYIMGSQSAISGASDNNVVLGNLNSINTSNSSAVLGGTKNRISGGGNFHLLAGNSNAISGSGTTDVVLGGANNTNTSTGSYSVTIGGNANTVSGAAQEAVILGGHANTSTSAFNSAIVGSNTSTTNKNYSTVLCGDTVTNTATYSLAFGNHVAADTAGSLTFGSSGSGSKTVIGESYGTTADATPAYLFAVDGATLRVPNSCAFSGILQVVAFASAAGTQAAYTIPISGSVSAGGVITLTNTAASAIGTPTLAIVSAPTANYVGGLTNQIYIQVTGIAATSIKWRMQANLNIVV